MLLLPVLTHREDTQEMFHWRLTSMLQSLIRSKTIRLSSICFSLDQNKIAW